MPGVPSGKGCDGCRKQKKKCDQAQPQCSRCARLGLTCKGAGQQRYKFKAHGCNPPAADEKTAIVRKSRIVFESTTEIPHAQDLTSKRRWLKVSPFTTCCTRAPSNDTTLLSSSFVHTMIPNTDVRYNLQHAYGGFLEYVPRRLGKNAALDAAVKAVVSGHRDVCSGHGTISPTSYRLYAQALAALRTCLNDPDKAVASETLCAVMVLLICQSFVGVEESSWTAHCEGAIRILRARGHLEPQDDFEALLMLTLRGPVLFSALFTTKLSLTPDEWRKFTLSKLDSGETPEGRMMAILASVPALMDRGQDARFYQSGTELQARCQQQYQHLPYIPTCDKSIRNDLRQAYERIKEITFELWDRIPQFEEIVIDRYQIPVAPPRQSPPSIPIPFHVPDSASAAVSNWDQSSTDDDSTPYENSRWIGHDDPFGARRVQSIIDALPARLVNNYSRHTRMFGICALVTLNINCMLMIFDPDNFHTLEAEAQSYVREIIRLAKQSHRYRPLGAAYISLCLTSAFAGAKDHETRCEVMQALEEYKPDYSWASTALKWEHMEAAATWLRYFDIDVPPNAFSEHGPRR